MSLEGVRDKVVAALGALGGTGLFLISFLDSSVLSFPLINDLLLVQFSIGNPTAMPYYALMATLGSVAGCVLLYFLARKGGEALFHRRAGAHAASVKAWIERNAFISVLIAGLLPPPAPFKAFVIAAGVFEVPLKSFVMALALARSARYFGAGFLAVRYGKPAEQYVKDHMLVLTAILLGFAVLSYVLAKLFVRRHPQP